MIYIWTLVAILSLFVEIIATSALVSIWFVAGALVALVAAIFKLDFNIQLFLFFVVSIISLAIFRPLFAKMMHGEVIEMGANRMIGKRYKLLEDIEPLKAGSIKNQGVIWTAISENSIKAGALVEVISIDGSKVIVREIKEG